jgi:hypothetical protein
LSGWKQVALFSTGGSCPSQFVQGCKVPDHGLMQLNSRHTTYVVPTMSLLHCPYRKQLQHVRRYAQLRHVHPPGHTWPGVRLQSMNHRTPLVEHMPSMMSSVHFQYPAM